MRHAETSETPLRPERVVATLQKILPETATLVSDPGTTCPYFSAYFTLPRAGRHFITNRAHGALGYALSASLGAWYGRPDSKVVALMGDGSFGFTAGELETILPRAGADHLRGDVEFGLWLDQGEPEDGQGGRYYNVDFGRTDHAAVAAAYGVKSWRVERPEDLERVLREAVETDGPTLVDIIAQPLEEGRRSGAALDGLNPGRNPRA